MIIAGTPKQVIAKLRILSEETRPGILAFWSNDGTVTHQDAKTSPTCGHWPLSLGWRRRADGRVRPDHDE